MHKIFYICDRKKCENCNSECKHTSDVMHAANFEPVHRVVDGQNIGETNDYFEKDLVVTPQTIYQPVLRDIITCTNATASSSKEE